MTARHALGQELRRARERRGISLADIAESTKITRSLLEGLERGDCSRWPGGIYTRAYVRDYARAIGLAPDDVLARFVACFAAASTGAAADGSPPTDASSTSAGLRLTMARDRADWAATLLARARLLAMDGVMVAGIAVAFATATGTDFWISAAAASLGCHAIGVLRTGGATTAMLTSWLRRAGTPPSASDEPQDDPVAPGRASVQLS